jgi:hypothetical protein
MKVFLSAIACVLLASGSQAAQCRSVSGDPNDVQASATREANLERSRITLTGLMAGQVMPSRVLTCAPTFEGVYCDRRFGPTVVTIMTDGTQMTETITVARTNQKISTISYVCDAPLK